MTINYTFKAMTIKKIILSLLLISISMIAKSAANPDIWPYIKEIIRAVRPSRCFFENVEGHISLGLREVIADLESLGYTATWGIFSAREVGAPHQRKRVYILADSNSVRCDRGQLPNRVSERSMEIETQQRPEQSLVRSQVEGCGGDSGENVADSIDKGLQRVERLRGNLGQNSGGEESANGAIAQRGDDSQQGEWPAEPNVGRVVDGCPDRVDRIRMLGNAVVPQTAAKAWLTLSKRL